MDSELASRAMRLLTATHGRLRSLNLPAHEGTGGSPTDNGGLLRHGYDLDSYLTFKSVAGDAVGIGVLRKKGDALATVMVHRRQKSGRAMPTVGVDKFALDDYPAAEAFFLASATLISGVDHSWIPAHPSDEFK